MPHLVMVCCDYIMWECARQMDMGGNALHTSGHELSLPAIISDKKISSVLHLRPELCRHLTGVFCYVSAEGTVSWNSAEGTVSWKSDRT